MSPDWSLVEQALSRTLEAIGVTARIERCDDVFDGEAIKVGDTGVYVAWGEPTAKGAIGFGVYEEVIYPGVWRRADGSGEPDSSDFKLIEPVCARSYGSLAETVALRIAKERISATIDAWEDQRAPRLCYEMADHG